MAYTGTTWRCAKCGTLYHSNMAGTKFVFIGRYKRRVGPCCLKGST